MSNAGSWREKLQEELAGRSLWKMCVEGVSARGSQVEKRIQFVHVIWLFIYSAINSVR